jgi:hypothetical protein
VINLPDGFDFVALVSDIVSLVSPFMVIMIIFTAYRLITKALKGGIG